MIEEEFPMAFLNMVEPQCICIDNLDMAEGLPQIVTEATIQEGDHDLVRISTYYHLSRKDQDGTEHQYPMSLYLKAYMPASSDQIVCAVFSGQVLTFLGQALSTIGPNVPSYTSQWNWDDQQRDGKDSSKIGFAYRNGMIYAADLNFPAVAASLTRKDIRQFSKVSEWISKLNIDLQDATSGSPGDLGFCREVPGTTLGEIRAKVPGGERGQDDFLSIAIPDWTEKGLSIGNSLRLRCAFLSALVLLPSAYGCLHFATLDSVFPSPLERTLWKMSFILFMASGGGAIVLFFIFYMDAKASKALGKHLLRRRKPHN
jgi:hypothetical protein